MKLVMAATLVVHAFTTPAFGHAHGRPHPYPDDPHDVWVDHDHALEPMASVEVDDHPETSSLGDAVFHWHGVWFGIRFSVPSPTSQRFDPRPLADAPSMPGMTGTGIGPGPAWQPGAWLLGHPGFDLPPPSALLCSTHLLRASPPPGESISPRAPRAGTILIRC